MAGLKTRRAVAPRGEKAHIIYATLCHYTFCGKRIYPEWRQETDDGYVLRDWRGQTYPTCVRCLKRRGRIEEIWDKV